MILTINDNVNIHLDKLVSENCLLLGQNPSSTKNSTKNFFILGRRNNVEVLKKNKIKFLLFRLYPLISGFYRTSLAVDDVKILFATTNKTYSKVVKEAALRCNMPYYVDRWLCGSITATSQNTQFALNQTFCPEKTREEKYYDFFYEKKYKKSINIGKMQYHKKNKWTTLAVVPDIGNNPMILREIDRAFIPTTGLVNNELVNYVTYPIFGNESSLYMVSFFCNLISKITNREKSLFSAKKKYIINLGKRKSYAKKVQIGKNKHFFFSRGRKKSYKGFWKFLKTYIFPGKNTPKFVKKIVKRKLKVRQYYIDKLRRKRLLDLKTNAIEIKKKFKLNDNNYPRMILKNKTSPKPFIYFTKKDFVLSMLLAKKRTNFRRLFRSYILLKSWKPLRQNKNSWIVNDMTPTRFLPISKKTFFKFKKFKKKKLKMYKKGLRKEYRIFLKLKTTVKKLKIKNKHLVQLLNSHLKEKTHGTDYRKLLKEFFLVFKKMSLNKKNLQFFILVQKTLRGIYGTNFNRKQKTSNKKYLPKKLQNNRTMMFKNKFLRKNLLKKQKKTNLYDRINTTR
jgi:ribosomal protein S2